MLDQPRLVRESKYLSVLTIKYVSDGYHEKRMKTITNVDKKWLNLKRLSDRQMKMLCYDILGYESSQRRWCAWARWLSRYCSWAGWWWHWIAPAPVVAMHGGSLASDDASECVGPYSSLSHRPPVPRPAVGDGTARSECVGWPLATLLWPLHTHYHNWPPAQQSTSETRDDNIVSHPSWSTWNVK